MTNVLSIISYPFLPAKMGGQKGIALFNKYFGQNVNLTCAGVKANDEKFAENYKLVKLFGKSSLRYINPLYFFHLKKIIKENKIEWLLLEHPYYGWLALLLKYFCKVKLIAKSHNIESLRFKSVGKWWWGILWHYEKLIFQKADKAFFITEEDRQFAMKHYKLSYKKCIVITYGTEREKVPEPAEKEKAKNTLRLLYGLNNEQIFLFNGTLNYPPNLDALKVILNVINESLLAKKYKNYKIIICGKWLPDDMNNLTGYADKNVIYAGFVDDIDVYFKAADVFLNPVIEGGGIKTKLVEALGMNLNIITTESGAIGVPKEVAGHKMKVVKDGDWKSFTEALQTGFEIQHTGKEFFEHFYWGNIAEKAVVSLGASPLISKPPILP